MSTESSDVKSKDGACLGFLIDAPMQSWGTSSRFQNRGTNHHPSKSAIAGIITAAMGIEKGSSIERETLAGIAELRLITVMLPRMDHRGSSVAMHRLRDFHTVGGGFSKKTHPTNIPRKAKGGPGDNATITEREYLSDTRFGVLIESRREATELLDSICEALVNPVWGIWFGRKCCLPSIPLAPEILENRETALAMLIKRAGYADTSVDQFEREEEVDNPVESDATFDDQPIAFGNGTTSGWTGRSFRLRGVRLHRAQIPKQSQEESK